MTERIVYVRLHSFAPGAVDATERTLMSLPGNACLGFVRDPVGGAVLVAAGGWVQARSLEPGLLAYAITNQGYAAQVSLEPPLNPGSDMIAEMLREANAELFMGHSPFTSLLFVGAYTAIDPVTYQHFKRTAAALNTRRDMPESLERLADRLRSVLADIEAQVAAMKAGTTPTEGGSA
jgi:hypothetical protein